MASSTSASLDTLTPDVQKLLLDTLAGGNVQAYSDLFHLATRPRISREDVGDTLTFLTQVRDELAAAEVATRSGNAKSVLQHYQNVGKMYASAEQMHIAGFYQDKCLDLSKITAQPSQEMSALYSLGASQEAIHAYAKASTYYESHRNAALALNDGKEIIKACTALVRVYSRQAAQCETRHEVADSLRLSTLALEAAKQCGDEKLEGTCYYAVGRASVMMGRANDGVAYLKNYLRIAKAAAAAALEAEAAEEAVGSSASSSTTTTTVTSKQQQQQQQQQGNNNNNNNSTGLPSRVDEANGAVGQAYAALAAAYQSLGDTEASSQCLQELLEVATASGNEIAQAEAAENIGVMHASAGRRDEAEPFLTSAFELRRKLVAAGRIPRTDLDKVRIMVGMIKGVARATPLMETVAKMDVKALLNWRVQRQELAGVVGVGVGGGE